MVDAEPCQLNYMPVTLLLRKIKQKITGTTNKSSNTIYPPLDSTTEIYMGCTNYQQVFPKLMTTFKATERVEPMKHITEEFVASLVADDIVHTRTTGYEGSHLIYTPEYTSSAVRNVIHPMLDAYASVWMDDIRTSMYDQVDYTMLDAAIRNHPREDYLPPTLYCMESTGMCTLGGDGLTRGRSMSTDNVPTMLVGGNQSVDRIEWINQRPLIINDTQDVGSIRSHQTPLAYVDIGPNIMHTETTLRTPRLE